MSSLLPAFFPEEAERASSPYNVWVGVVFLVGLWLLVRPYFGIRHDGILYTAQAYARLMPDIFKQDIFFAYGSQDDFTLYSRGFAFLIQRVGLADATIGLLVIALSTSAVSAYFVFKNMLPPLWLWLGFLILTSFPHLYGAHQIFAFGEPFLTARSVAEPFCLLAIFALWQGRLILALSLASVGFFLHPLITIPVIAVGWLYLVQQDRRWLWAATFIPFFLIPAFLDIEPFSKLLLRFDEEWFEMVNVVNSNVFPLRWKLEDWSGAGYDLTVLTLATAMFTGKVRRLTAAVLLACMGSILLAILGADLAHNVLITALQLWRTLWLGHLFALVLTPYVLWRLSTRDGFSEMAAWLLLTAILTAAYLSAAVCLVMAWALLLFSWRGEQELSSSVKGLLKAASVGAIAITSIRVARTMWPETSASHGVGDFVFILSIPAVAGLLGLCFLRVLLAKKGMVIALPVALLCFSVGVFYWDHRSDFSRYIENGVENGKSLRAEIPKDAQVYWDGNNGASLTWFLLNRASYFSPDQSAGLLFNRKTAIEFKKRGDIFSIFYMQDAVCKTFNQLNNTNELCLPRAELLKETCDENEKLDFMVFGGDVGRWVDRTVDLSVVPGGEKQRYYFYSCATIRSEAL